MQKTTARAAKRANGDARSKKKPAPKKVASAHQINHALPVIGGGDAKKRSCPRRSPALNVIPPDWTPAPGVPSSREECRGKENACRFVRCRHHLWLQLSEDRDGRPYDGKKAPSRLRPMSATACSLAVAERGPRTLREVGDLLGVSDERVRAIIKRAVVKFAMRGGQLG